MSPIASIMNNIRASKSYKNVTTVIHTIFSHLTVLRKMIIKSKQQYSKNALSKYRAVLGCSTVPSEHMTFWGYIAHTQCAITEYAVLWHKQVCCFHLTVIHSWLARVFIQIL